MGAAPSGRQLLTSCTGSSPAPSLQALALQCGKFQGRQKPRAVRTDGNQGFYCMRRIEHYQRGDTASHSEAQKHSYDMRVSHPSQASLQHAIAWDDLQLQFTRYSALELGLQTCAGTLILWGVRD